MASGGLRLAASGISIPEFRTAVANVCGGSWPSRPWRIGLAISGGVDSMALALLVSRFRQANPDDFGSVYAFIVDHKLRENSTEEASLTRRRLEALGIDTRILTLDWPEQPSKASLETSARKLRFRALGTACAQERISSLLLAHHQDDQVETVLTRLVTGYAGDLGLRGIPTIGRMPHVHGIYGADGSGRANEANPETPFQTESGGVKLLRPFLSLPKSRLVATCQEAQLQWAEDTTNADPGLTWRNAVRHIYREYSLPRALNPDRIAELAEHFQQRRGEVRREAQALYDDSNVHVDVRSGIAEVQLPTSLQPSPNPSSADLLVRKQFVDQLVGLVTPKPDWSSNDTSAGATELFSSNVPRSFTERSVLFTPVEKPRLCEGANDRQTWRLCRQPPSARDGSTHAHLLNKPLSVDPKGSQWQLFDNRFWVSISNPSPHPLVLRLFNPEADLPRLGHIRTQIDLKLKRATRGTVERYGLPVLAHVTDETMRKIKTNEISAQSIAENSTPFGFPTLHVWDPTFYPGSAQTNEQSLVEQLSVQVRYREIPPGTVAVS